VGCFRPPRRSFPLIVCSRCAGPILPGQNVAPLFSAKLVRWSEHPVLSKPCVIRGIIPSDASPARVDMSVGDQLRQRSCAIKARTSRALAPSTRSVRLRISGFQPNPKCPGAFYTGGPECDGRAVRTPVPPGRLIPVSDSRDIRGSYTIRYTIRVCRLNH
jgi:hypothetical protein